MIEPDPSIKVLSVNEVISINFWLILIDQSSKIYESGLSASRSFSLINKNSFHFYKKLCKLLISHVESKTIEIIYKIDFLIDPKRNSR